MKAKQYIIHSLSPLHIGTGQGLGFIDLPIMRDKITNFPLVPGSSLKGVVADYFNATEAERKAKAMLAAAFGTAGEKHSNAGALVFTDARMLCLPVRSIYGTFAWVTCPMILECYKRDLNFAGNTDKVPETPVISSDDNAVVQDGSALVGKSGQQNAQRIFFEDLDFKPVFVGTDKSETWATYLAGKIFPKDKDWKGHFEKRFAVVSDDTFGYLCETGTEVNARIKIDEKTGTAATGSLRYEEALPSESILYGMVWGDKVFKPEITLDNLLSAYCEKRLDLQLGGHGTVGKGRVRMTFSN